MIMNKIELFYGFVIGVFTAFVGSFFFIEIATEYSFIEGIQTMKITGQLGKIITLGAILDLLVFYVLLKFNKEIMARGVVLALIILTLLTLFV